MSARHRAAAILILLVAALPAAAAENTLAAARDLYAAAAYEDALAILNQLSGGSHGADEERAIQQYRAFCLLALGRTADAEQAIAAVVAVQPRYQPSDDVSPRVRTTFAEVRRRVLPTVIQQQYAIAKASYDRKNYAEAAERFNYVLEVLNDPDVRPSASQPPLSDLRTLAMGFRDLAVTNATPPPKVEPPPPPPVAVAPEPAVPAAPRIYNAGDRGVVPPVTVRQALPPFPNTAAVPKQAQGVIEVVIDETGAVEQALIRVALNAAYDRQALSAARSWLYQPATLNGKPVKFRKAVQIKIAR
jgi:tetratricopeptide (TPR) repeat protein